MSIKKTIVVFGVLSALAMSLVAFSGCQAEKFPTRPISMAVFSSAGSPSDLRARESAKTVEKILGQSIAIENRTGGGGVQSFTWAKGQPADGYSLVSSTQDIAWMAAKADAPIKMDEFESVIMQTRQPGSVIVRSETWKTMEEFLANAKANPGKVKFGGQGSGLQYDSRVWELGKLTGTSFTYVPFAGGSEVVPALLGGHIDAAMMSPTVPMPHIKEGTLRMLAVSNDKRWEPLPDVPTFKEKGINMEYYRWGGMFVKKGTPAERVKIIHDAFKQAQSTPEWKKFLETSTESDAYMDGPAMDKLFVELSQFAAKYFAENK